MSCRPDITKTVSDTTRVIISLGANLDSPVGTPAQTIRAVSERLRSWSTGPFAASSLYRTSPEGCPAGVADFINAVVSLTLPLDTNAEQLLRKLQALENEFGRRRGGLVNESRPLDLDLIALGARQSQSPDLCLPHPRAHQRRFVLQPLVEIDPQLILPGQQQSVAALLQQLSEEQVCERVGSP